MYDKSVNVPSPLAGPSRWAVASFGRAARQRLAAHAQVLAFGTVYVVWGSTYLGIRIGVETIPPFMLAAARALAAGIPLLAWTRLTGAPRATARDWRRAAVAGTLMLAGGNGLVSWAETRISSSLAALLIALVPAYITLFDWARPGGTRPTRGAALGVGAGMLGMMLLVRPGAASVGASHWEGVAALALAGMCWAVGSLYARYQPMHPNRAVSSAHQMIAGGAVLTIVAGVDGEFTTFDASAVSLRSLAALAYLTLFGSLLAFSAFNWLIGVTTPARLATTAYVNPLVALLLGWVVLGETLHPVSLAGALLIIGAVALMSCTRASSPSATPPSPSSD